MEIQIESTRPHGLRVITEIREQGLKETEPFTVEDWVSLGRKGWEERMRVRVLLSEGVISTVPRMDAVIEAGVVPTGPGKSRLLLRAYGEDIVRASLNSRSKLSADPFVWNPWARAAQALDGLSGVLGEVATAMANEILGNHRHWVGWWEDEVLLIDPNGWPVYAPALTAPMLIEEDGWRLHPNAGGASKWQ